MNQTLHTFLRRADAEPNRAAIRELKAGGAAADNAITWGEWAQRARSFAFALREAGCEPGDRVAILAENSALWPIADMGGLLAGAISVGVYPTGAPVQVHSVLNDCAAKVVVVDTLTQLEKVRSVRNALPGLRTVVCAEGNTAAESFQKWISGPQLQNVHDPAPDDVAILIYTSGSTGEPKGACISHRCLSASAASIQQTLGLTAQDSSLSFLPFCHAAERIFGMFTRIHCGMTAGMITNHTRIWEAARSFEPTLFGGLPRFYEKLYEFLRAEFAEVTERNAEAVRVRLAEFTGGRVRLATSGGAALPAEVWEYLNAAGLEVLGAYGLTEHLCATMHRPGSAHSHSAGEAMPGTEIAIGDSGEVLIRKSDLTFSGYHNKPEETAASFTADGAWLRTGDLGELDAAGYLRLTGREKELIALSTGKKVAPLPIEARLLNSPLISQAVLVGENRKYISALISLRPAVVMAWARERGLAHSYEQLVQHPDLYAVVQHEVDRVNQDLSRTEQIRRFVLLPDELSVERNELTPTLKVRRTVIAERYREQLESLYQVSA